MIRRFYVHNFRCLENFELPVSGQPSVLLIGKNGSGKTTVGLALWLLRKIAGGTNRVDKLVKPKDLASGRKDVPVRFEIQAELEGRFTSTSSPSSYRRASKSCASSKRSSPSTKYPFTRESMRKCALLERAADTRASRRSVLTGTWWLYP